MAHPLLIEVALFNPPFGSPLARGSLFPQPSLIFDTGGKPRGDALAIAHMLAATVLLTMPRGAQWRVHVDEFFTGAVITSLVVNTTKRRVWIELQKTDSVEQAFAVLGIVARREGPGAKKS